MSFKMVVVENSLFVHYPHITTEYLIEKGSDGKRYIDFDDELECLLFINENDLDDIETHLFGKGDATAICLEDIIDKYNNR